MPLEPIEQTLPRLVRVDRKAQALSNWAVLQQQLSLPTSPLLSDENIRALVATILCETGNTFEPVKENGTPAYFRRMYWENNVARESLGNITPSDAADYCGKGFIQLTGRDNYERCGCALNLPLLSQPELLLTPEVSARAALWFWNVNGLATLVAEACKHSDTPSRDRGWRMVRMRVNGPGCNGLAAFLSDLTALGIR